MTSGMAAPWMGLGFGLERLMMVKEGYQNIERVGGSLIILMGFN